MASTELAFEFEEGGKIRLARIQYALQSGIIDYDHIIDYYEKWVNQDEGFILELQPKYPAKHLKKKFIAVKCAKRGNDVYRWRVNNKIKHLDNALSKIGIKITDRTSNCLFITLTSATLLFDNQAHAWQTIGGRFNRFITNIKKKYGKIDYVRAWESTEKGYPHVHLLLIFHDAEFHIFVDEKGKIRIKEKEEIDKYWDSFVDVQVPKDVKHAKDYVIKEIFKHGFSLQNDPTTLAFLWVFRKRAFSISHGLASIIRLDISMHNSNQILRSFDLFGMPIDEFVNYRWVFVGVFSWNTILEKRKDGQKDGLWSYELKSIP